MIWDWGNSTVEMIPENGRKIEGVLAGSPRSHNLLPRPAIRARYLPAVDGAADG